MEKINTGYKRRIWKIEAKLFNMRKPWLSSFKFSAVREMEIYNGGCRNIYFETKRNDGNDEQNRINKVKLKQVYVG